MIKRSHQLTEVSVSRKSKASAAHPRSKSTSIKQKKTSPSAIPPIVGIGASAGGLEALELFLKHVPAGSEIAFVVVQHLDPVNKSRLAEILQRAKTLNVAWAENLVRVNPDCVYVAPPNKFLSILHGVLYLHDPTKEQKKMQSIDFFANFS